jgi:hypothetical protein
MFLLKGSPIQTCFFLSLKSKLTNIKVQYAFFLRPKILIFNVGQKRFRQNMKRRKLGRLKNCKLEMDKI